VTTFPFAEFPGHIAFPYRVEFAVFWTIQLKLKLVGMLLVLSHLLKIEGISTIVNRLSIFYNYLNQNTPPPQDVTIIEVMETAVKIGEHNGKIF